MYLKRLIVIGVLCFVRADDDNDCVKNLYKRKSDSMHFTKEASNLEFAIARKFKALHCCAFGYTSIEWLKDGMPHPWPSSFIIYPNSANQTIYTHNVNPGDKGNYSCVLKNDTSMIVHEIHLEVFDPGFIPDDPKITYITKDVQVRVGDYVRLFCEAFVDKINLPDAQRGILWMRNGTTAAGNARITDVRRDNFTIGSYLTFDSIEEDDLDTYTCRITTPGKVATRQVSISELSIEFINPNPVPVKNILVVTIIVSLIVMTSLLLYKRFGLAARVYLKDHSVLDDYTPRSTDVLIVYSADEDETYVFMLMNVLTTCYHYNCKMIKLANFTENKCSSILEDIANTYCLITILSPAALDNNWSSKSLYTALKNLEHFGNKLTCIALNDIPVCDMVKNSIGETLSTLLNKMNVLQWKRRQEEDKFWLSLRLNLPPIRRSRSPL